MSGLLVRGGGRPLGAGAGPLQRASSSSTSQRPQVRTRATTALTVAQPSAASATKAGGRQHVLQTGETLALLESQYGLAAGTLEAANASKLIRPGQIITIPAKAGHPLLEDARSAVRVISSASLDSLSAVQRTAAANAPAIQFVGGLGAAAVFGRMLLQWAPSLAPSFAQNSEIDALIKQAQQEIHSAEGQLSKAQAVRLQQTRDPPAAAAVLAPGRSKAAPSLPAASSSTAAEPNLLQRVLTPVLSAATPPPSEGLPGSSTGAAGQPAPAPPAGGSDSLRKAAPVASSSAPAAAQLKPKASQVDERQQQQSLTMEREALPPSQQRAAAQPPAFATPAPLVVTSSPQPSPRAPLEDPYFGKSLLTLKSGLLDNVYGTARGIMATSRQRAAIEEHIIALEARNPQPKPTNSMGMMGGTWKLVYTSHQQTLLLLNAIDSLPLVDIGDVYQIIDANAMTAINKIEIAVPVTMALTSEAKFEVRTPRAFKVRFTKVGLDSYVNTPQLTSSLDIPESITVMGNKVDLTLLRELMNPVNAGLEVAQGVLQNVLTPEVGVQASDLTSAYMVTTYLDEGLRVSRDEAGRVWVMIKVQEDGSDEDSF